MRPPRDSDAAWIVESVADPEIPRWTRVPWPYTKDDALAWIAVAQSMLRSGSAYHLLVTGAEDDVPLGSVGLEVHSRPTLHGELGYWVAAPARGRGIATRSVGLLVGWAANALPLPLFEIHVLPENARSRAVAVRTGFQPAGQRLLPFRGRMEEFDVYAAEAPELTARNSP